MYCLAVCAPDGDIRQSRIRLEPEIRSIKTTIDRLLPQENRLNSISTSRSHFLKIFNPRVVRRANHLRACYHECPSFGACGIHYRVFYYRWRWRLVRENIGSIRLF